MDTKELRYFLEVCETMNIRNAASNLFITPQGLSKVIKKLETELGATLFLRSNHGVVLTQSGKLLMKKAEHIIQEIEDIAYEMQRLIERQSSIRLACSYGILSAFSPDIIFTFMRKYPQVKVRWKEYTDKVVEEIMVKNNADYGLIIGPVDNNMFEEELIRSYAIVLQVYEGHPLYDEKVIQFHMLDGQDIISESKDFKIYHTFSKKCKENHVKPNIVFETTEISFAHKLCQKGMGLAVVVDYVAEDLSSKGVRTIPFADPEFRWEVYLIKKKNAVSKGVFREFETFIKKWN